MKSALLIMLLAAAATAAVACNEVPDVVRVPDIMGLPHVVEEHEVADIGEVADEDVYEMPDVFVTDSEEVIDVDELTAEAQVSKTEGEMTDEVAGPVQSRRNLSRGSICVRLLNREYRANGVAGRIQERTIRVSTNGLISAVRVTRVGASQNATPSITGGGIGRSTITIRIRSAVGRGYHYRVQIYAT